MTVARALMVALAIVAFQEGALAQSPSQYEQAVADRMAGRSGEAARLLRAWLIEHPEDADARLQLAYAELALGNLDAAENGFRTVLATAPEYEDARQGLKQVEARRRSSSGAASRPQLFLEGGWSDGGSASDWYEAGGRLSLPSNERTTLEAAVTHYRRFGTNDVEVGAAVTHRAGQDLWLRFEATATPEADFRPSFGIGAGADCRLRSGNAATVLTFDVRHQNFPAEQVTTVSPGLVQYFAGGRGWITGRAFGVLPEDRELQLGWLLRADFVPAERHRIFGGVADGPDTDLGVVTQITSLFGGVEVPLGQRFALTAAASREWRKSGADRHDFRLGLKIGL